jgi:hypothetical protein
MGLLDGIAALSEAEGLVSLSKTTHITNQVANGNPIWKELMDDYRKDNLTPEQMCAVTIFNAALTHNRRVFVMTRDGIESLLRSDLNWVNRPKFNTKSWSKYLMFLYQRKLIKKLSSDEAKVSVYELTHAPLLEAIPDSPEQRQQALDFAERHNKPKTPRSIDKSAPYSNFKESSGEFTSKLKVHVPNPEDLEEIEKTMKFDFTDDDID